MKEKVRSLLAMVSRTESDIPSARCNLYISDMLYQYAFNIVIVRCKISPTNMRATIL